MILAKNRNGQIGRFIPGTGLQAQVDVAPVGERRGSVNISARSIEEDEAFYNQQEAEARAIGQARRIENIARAQAEQSQNQKRRKDVEAFQRLANFDPMNEQLKRFFTNRAGMGESEIVADSLLRDTADFSSSGGNSNIVPSEGGKRAIAWRADFRQHLIVGNPLTRDGEYGPAVTDYDRYVQGTDVNQSNVVNLHAGGVPERLLSYYSETMDDELPIAGGTMLGRYNGEIAPAGMGRQATEQAQFARRANLVPTSSGRNLLGMGGPPRSYAPGQRRGIPRGLPGRFNSDQGTGSSDLRSRSTRRSRALPGMGAWDDWVPSWGEIGDSLSDVASSTYDQVIDDIPDLLANELRDAITGGGTVTSTGGGVVTVQRPITGAVTTVSQTIGLPPWAIYAGVGLIGIGTLFMIIKAVKK